MTKLTIANFKPLSAGAMRGFFDCILPSGIRLHGCTVMMGAKGPWIALPSRPMIGRDGAVLTGPDGKRRYEPVVTFAAREVQDRFSAVVLEALRAAHPEVLA